MSIAIAMAPTAAIATATIAFGITTTAAVATSITITITTPIAITRITVACTRQCVRLLRMITNRRRQSVKKHTATTSNTALELRRRAEADRQQEESSRLARKDAERRAALDDLEAQRSLEAARADAAAKRIQELEASRLARKEAEASRLAAAREMHDKQWMQVRYPLELANRLIAWRSALTHDQVVVWKGRISHLVRSGRTQQTVETPYWWTEDTRLTCALGSVRGVDGQRHSVRSSKDFEWLLFNNGFAAYSHNDAIHMLHRLWDKVCPDGRCLLQGRYQAGILLHECQYVVEKAFVHGIFLMYRILGNGWLPGEFVWPPVPPPVPPVPPPAPLAAAPPVPPAAP